MPFNSSIATVPEALNFRYVCTPRFDSIVYRTNANSDQQASGVITITQSPTLTPSPTQTSSPDSSRNSVPIAAIVAPVVVGVFAIACIIGLLFVLRRRRRRAANAAANAQEMADDPAPVALYGGEMAGDAPVAGEMKGSTVRYAHELETKEYTEPIELDGENHDEDKSKTAH